MGKPTGFMDYNRQEIAMRPPQKRLQDWCALKSDLSKYKSELQTQAARCMDCSIPFCHSGIMLNGAVSGCPLHNLMPEFNDFVYQDLDDIAYARLNKTNNFPEFTSHVCPAPCEGACTAGLITKPVTIKNIEQYVIDQAFGKGLVKPYIPEQRSGKKVAIVGSGPAGLACADELNKLGHTITVFERADRAGGLLMYGIPNMKLEKKLVERRLKILKDSGIKFELNSSIGYNIPSEMLLKQFDAVVLCTGSTVPRDLPIPGRALEGIHFAKDYLHQTTKTLLDSKFKDNPLISAEGKDVLVIGGGDTGTDCVATALRQHCKSIRQIEIMPCLPSTRAANNPWPEFPRTFKTDYGQEEALTVNGEDPRQYSILTHEFIGENNKVTHVKISQAEWLKKDGRLTPCSITGTKKEIPAQLILLALGFVGTEQTIFDEFDVQKTQQNNIAADEKTFSTSIPGVFAAGDARRGQSLVVWAIAEGRKAAASVNEYLTVKTE